jgi:hypothetical protein
LDADNELKNIINTRFQNLRENNTDILTLKETGQANYVWGKGLLKSLSGSPMNFNNYPPCDN